MVPGAISFSMVPVRRVPAVRNSEVTPAFGALPVRRTSCLGGCHPVSASPAFSVRPALRAFLRLPRGYSDTRNSDRAPGSVSCSRVPCADTSAANGALSPVCGSKLRSFTASRSRDPGFGRFGADIGEIVDMAAAAYPVDVAQAGSTGNRDVRYEISLQCLAQRFRVGFGQE